MHQAIKFMPWSARWWGPLLLAAGLACPPGSTSAQLQDQDFGGAGWATHHYQAPGLADLAIRAPVADDGTAHDAILLLHGQQGTVAQPAWFIQLGEQPGLERTVLVAPGLPGGAAWTDPGRLDQLAAIVAQLAREQRLGRVFVLGYSSGVTPAFQVAGVLAGQVPLAGVIAVAGTPRVKTVGALPVLMLCMSQDQGSFASCAGMARGQQALEARGAGPVTLAEVPGGHTLDLHVLAPFLAAWLRTAPG